MGAQPTTYVQQQQTYVQPTTYVQQPQVQQVQMVQPQMQMVEMQMPVQQVQIPVQQVQMVQPQMQMVQMPMPEMYFKGHGPPQTVPTVGQYLGEKSEWLPPNPEMVEAIAAFKAAKAAAK